MTTNFDYFKTHDGLSIRYAIRPAQVYKWGTVVLLSGRNEFIEKYDETCRTLNARGYDVYTFDWRGQGLSSRILEDRHKGHVGDYQEYVCDLDLFMEEHVRPNAKGPFILLAHSMGAHISLRYLRERPDRIDCAVFTAPMIGIRTFPVPPIISRLLTAVVTGTGQHELYAPGNGGYHPEHPKIGVLTSCPDRFREEKELIRQNPELALGGVTYGWLDASYRSMGILRRPEYAKKIRTPILVCSAAGDRVVSNRAQRRLCGRLPDARFVSIPGARHDILRERDEIRRFFWEEFDEFVSLF